MMVAGSSLLDLVLLICSMESFLFDPFARATLRYGFFTTICSVRMAVKLDLISSGSGCLFAVFCRDMSLFSVPLDYGLRSSICFFSQVYSTVRVSLEILDSCPPRLRSGYPAARNGVSVCDEIGIGGRN